MFFYYSTQSCRDFRRKLNILPYFKFLKLPSSIQIPFHYSPLFLYFSFPHFLQVYMYLPTTIADPVERMKAVHERTDLLKRSPAPYINHYFTKFAYSNPFFTVSIRNYLKPNNLLCGGHVLNLQRVYLYLPIEYILTWMGYNFVILHYTVFLKCVQPKA